ncbi:MAG: hypothetical protein WA971_03590, partial [Microbacterium sp.]
FVVHGLTFDGSAVSGTLEVTSDVSDLLELVVVAGFYDADGRMVGTARFEEHAEGEHEHTGPPSEATSFRIEVPAGLPAAAVSAAAGVPVLVNE